MIEKIDSLFEQGFGSGWAHTCSPQAANSVIDSVSSVHDGDVVQIVKGDWQQVGEPASLSYGVYNHSKRLVWSHRID